MTASDRIALALFAPAALAALAAAPALAQDAGPPPPPAPPAAAPAAAPSGPQAFEVSLVGDEETPDEGDPDGKASGTVTIDPAKGTVCADIEYHRLAPATMAHVHAGARGKAGPPVVTLPVDDGDGVVKGCAKAAPDAIAAILADPAGYYVNVHTTELPKGAIRGQLKR